MHTTLKGSYLSIQQQRLWKMQEGKALYLVRGILLLEGSLDYGTLRAALQALVERHEILRTVFRRLPGMDMPVQVLNEDAVQVTESDLTEFTSAEQERQLASLFAQMRLDTSLLDHGPLRHIHLVRLSARRNFLLLCLPALCVDAVSLRHIAADLGAVYHALLAGERLEDEPLQYADIASWQADLLQEEDAREYQAAWRKLDFARSSAQYLVFDEKSFHVSQPAQGDFFPLRQDLPIDESFYQQLQVLAQAGGVSLETVLLTGWQVLLSRLTEQPAGVLGLACDGREYEDLAELPGLYTRIVPFQAPLLEERTLMAALREVETLVQDTRKRQNYFTWDLSSGSQEEQVSFFPTSFTFSTWRAVRYPSGLSISCAKQEGYTERFLLNLQALERDNELNVALEYDPRYLSAEYIQRLATMFVTFLRNAVCQPEQIIGKLGILDEPQRQWLLDTFAQTNEAFPQQHLWHQLFEKQAELFPEQVALVCGQESITYQQLNRQANQLAHYLRKQGIRAAIPVAICMERSLAVIVSLLAVLKAGGSYVPLDSSSPVARLSAQFASIQVENSAPILITRQDQLEHLPAFAGTIICLDRDAELLAAEPDDNPEIEISLDDIAYIIYTSGSTGNPKGVQICHRSILNYTWFMCQRIASLPGLNFATVSTLAADLGNTAIFCALASGGCLHVLTYEVVTSSELFASYVRDHLIDVLKIVPSHLKALLAARPPEAQRALLPRKYLVLGGEAFSEEFACQLSALEPPCIIYNHYGPTEATVGALVNDLGRLEAYAVSSAGAESEKRPATVPIGRPIANTEAYILSPFQQIVPVGLAGELYLGGVGLSTGYRLQPEQTRERFIPHPFAKQAQAVLYRTGDRARYTADGKIEFLGRVDTQVKIRGYRVELQEIEAVLEHYDSVRECVVVLREDPFEKVYLVAYVVTRPRTTLTLEELRAYLHQHLPEYMLPATFVFLQSLPLTANGKVDRRALPAPEQVVDASRAAFVAPRTPLEAELVSIWQSVLHVERLGVNDNFFRLGGHSLLATQLISRIRARFDVDFPILQFFNAPTIGELAQLLEQELQRTSASDMPLLRSVERGQDLPLSFAQQRLWFLDQLDPGSTAYSIPIAMELVGNLDVLAFEKSLREIVRRHEILRTTFQNRQGQPVQVIGAPEEVAIEYRDLRGEHVEAREQMVQQLAEEEARQPFDLARGPLMRVVLLCSADERHVLLLTMHHIITDGWSNGVFIRELALLYAAFVRAEPSPLAELPLQYADFALWQQQWLQGAVLERQLEYWRRQLKDIQPLQLQADHPRPLVQTFHGAQQVITLPRHLHQGLQELSQREGATFFMTLLSAFQVLLYRLSGQLDIAVGTDIANRNRGEIEGLIGFFVNQLVMRADLSGNPSFLHFLASNRQVALEAYAHQDVPFEKLVEVLKPERDLSRSPLFQVAFVLQNRPEYEQLLDVTLRPLDNRPAVARLDLTLGMIETPDSLQALLEYNTDLFEPATISRLLRHWQCLLEAILRDPASRLDDLELLLPEEKRQLLVEWNATETNYPLHRSFSELFAEQVARRPGAVALVDDDGSTLSYEQLNELSNRMARALFALGVCPGEHVGVYMERSLEIVVTLLGIFKVGGVYIPLDPAYPVERLSYMVEDADMQVVVTQPALAETIPSTRASVFCLDATWEVLATYDSAALSYQPDPLATAYVIYTSGSTGKPKGVMVHHAGMLNHLFAKIADLTLSDADSIGQTASHCFDISLWQFLAALLVGGQVHILRQEIAHDPARLFAYVARAHLTILEVVPALLASFIHNQTEPDTIFPRLRYLVVTGEALPAELCRRWLKQYPAIPLVNAYGPTECSDDVTHAFIAAAPAANEVNVPIGRAISNTQLYILDEHLLPVPIGVAGQLYIGGAGVGLGYHNLPALTAATFLPDPFGSRTGGRLYRTGDLVRYLPDGQIEFLERVDYQVKIRGFRIELDEIQAIMRQHPAVQDCLVLVREDRAGEKRLVAYIASPSTSASLVEELREYLRAKVPEYMVPAAYVVLAALPLTPNGKVDRRALPAPALEAGGGQSSREARTPLEEILVHQFAEVLGVSHVSPHDSFFELGGHSLLATQLLSRVRRVLGVELPLRALFEAPTVEQLGRRVEQRQREEQGRAGRPPLGVVSRQRRMALSFAQQRLWFLEQLEPGNTSYLMPIAIRWRGALRREWLEQSLREVVKRHESLRTHFEEEDGRGWQVIEEEGEVEVEEEEGRGWGEEEVKRWVNEEAKRTFDLSRGPLVRVKLVRIGEEEGILLLVMHHIISDGWSLGVLVRELTQGYAQVAQGRQISLPELGIQYADFAAWQREWLAGDELERQLLYWRKHLQGASAFELPADRPRGIEPGAHGANYAFTLAPELQSALYTLCRKEGVTAFMTLFAVFQTLLYRYTEQEDIVVGTDIANRTTTETEALIGFFVNLLALRTDLSGKPTFRELLQRVREIVLEAYTYQDMPFEQIVDHLRLERNMKRTPLVNILFVLQNVPLSGGELAGVEITPYKIEETTSKFDVAFFLLEENGSLRGVINYSTDLFDERTIQRMSSHYQVLLQSALASPDESIQALEMDLPEEKAQKAQFEKKLLQANRLGLKQIKGEEITLGNLFQSESERANG